MMEPVWLLGCGTSMATRLWNQYGYKAVKCRALLDTTCFGGQFSDQIPIKSPGPSCSKLTTSLINEMLKFQTLISQICQFFLLKKCEKLLQCKSFSYFFNKKYHCIM